MTSKYIFESERLGFRLWEEKDKIPFADMNANKEVMKYFLSILSKEQSDKLIDKINTNFNKTGYGLWVVEIKETEEFIGFIGFLEATFQSEFTPCVEIGWRLDDKYWNSGYATEGAKTCLEYGFDSLGLNEVYSFTSVVNEPSINVMKKIGLSEQRTFNHPNIEEGHILRPHVLYRIDKEGYSKFINRSFNKFSNNWDTERRIKRAKLIADEIKKSINVNKQKALEFGCGTGLISFNMYSSFESIDLADNSEGMIEVLENKIKFNEISNMRAIDLNKQKLDSKYDVIYSSMVLHHILDLDSLTKQFHELLNEEGEICIVDLNSVDEAFHKDEPDFDGYHGINTQELEWILSANGFYNIKTNTFFEGVKIVDEKEIPYTLFLLTATKI